jgi:DNA-binding MarR family transcriptional regulator
MTTALTDNQVRALVAIYDRQHSGLPLMTTRSLADEMGGSPEGMGITTGSLVRRGCLTRERRNGRVHFRLTEKGEAVAAPAWRAEQ